MDAFKSKKKMTFHRTQATRMKALILQETKNIRLTNIKTPECNPNETLLKVTHCSICRTDAKSWAQGQRDLVLPRILGHEICGQKTNSTDRYIVWPASTCGNCDFCKNGAENLCSNIQVIGFHRDGGFAEYVKVPTDSLIKVPPTLPSEIACMTELMSSAVNAVEQVNLQKNQKVLIYGGGPAGLLLGLACKAFGAEPFIVEKNPEKIKLSTAFCKEANLTISNDVPCGLFDVAINAAPDSDTFSEGLTKLKSGGKFCLFSGFTKNGSLSADLMNEVHYRQLAVVGAYGSTKRQMETALKILEKNHTTIKLLIHKIINLEEVPSALPEILAGVALKYIVNLQTCDSDTLW